jgi:hypothetical protein
MPPGRYASAGDPLPDFAVPAPKPEPTPAALELPADEDDLEGWLVARFRVVTDRQLSAAIRRAEIDALQRFAPGTVTKALRRVLTNEMVNR